MTNPSGAKGTAWETAVTRFMGGCGLLAKRKRQRGSKDTADIEVPGLEDLLVIEAKNWKSAGLGGWVDEMLEEAKNAGVPVGVVWHHRNRKGSPGDGYVTTTGNHFVRLLQEIIFLRHRNAELETAMRVMREAS